MPNQTVTVPMTYRIVVEFHYGLPAFTAVKEFASESAAEVEAKNIIDALSKDSAFIISDWYIEPVDA